MALDYKTPGVYVEEKSLLPPSVAGVATAIPAFIGYTEKKTKNPVQKVTSLLEFQNLFGEGKELTVKNGQLKGQEFVLYDSMRLYFDNGGGTCYVASAGTYEEAELEEPTQQQYKDAIAQVAQQAEVTLLVFPDAAMLLDLDDLKAVQEEALAQCVSLVGRFVILDVQQNLSATYATPSEQIDGDIDTFRNKVSKDLCYGAAYYPYLKTSYPKDIPFREVLKALGIISAAPTDDVNPAAPADDVNSEAQQEKDEEPVFDRKQTPTQEQIRERAAWIARQDEKDPVIKMKMNAIIPLIDKYAETLEDLKDEASVIPPSGAIAGLYVATDNRVGVWQAPANVGIAGIKDVCVQINDNQQAGMNVDPLSSKSINAIRFFKGKGILVWGSRTLDGGSEEWKYVPVRRLFSYVEQSVKLATDWAVFQPNDANTWVRIKCQISNFLSTLWRDGALAGASADEAFFVEVGKGITMTESDINNGLLRVRIGLAAVRPAEFIILEFSHKVQE